VLRNRSSPASASQTSLSLANDGTLAFCFTEPTEPAEVGVTDADGKNMRRLTDLNRALKDEVEFVRPERIPV